MDDAPDDAVHDDASPDARSVRVRRVVKLLVIADLCILLAAVGTWLLLRGGEDRANAVNEGLRGSRPPAGQAWPELSDVAGIEPAMPTLRDVLGQPTVLVATCTSCRSGDVIGGFLGRLGVEALPDEARVVVLTWGADQASWIDRWQVDDERFELHHASGEPAIARVRRELGIAPVGGAEESGVAFVHDPNGRWRSSFFIGQLDREDLAHDLAELAD